MYSKGTQILYIPPHVDKDDLDHHDVQHGFVTSENDSFVFCRFWMGHNGTELRTQLNSEAVPKQNIIQKDTRPGWLVRWALKKYC